MRRRSGPSLDLGRTRTKSTWACLLSTALLGAAPLARAQDAPRPPSSSTAAEAPAVPSPLSSDAPPAAPVINSRPQPTVSIAPPPEARPSRATPAAKGGPGDPASVAAGPGGFSIGSFNSEWQIRFRALVQADGRFWFEDTERPQTNTFLLRRVQTPVEGKLPYGISFLVNPDFGGGTTTLQDAYLGLDIEDGLRLRFGKFRPPFGLERLQPTSNLSFVEFGIPTLLTPNRDVGAMVYGDLFGRFFGYAAGIFNGVPDNGTGDLDTDSDKEFAGRAYLRPFAPLKSDAFGRLFIGVATTFGRVHGTPTNPSFSSPVATPAYKTPGQATDFAYIGAASGVAPDSSNTVVANGPHNRYGVYLYEALGAVSLMGEYYLADQEVGRAGKGNVWIHNKAYQAQATVVLFGAKAAYDFVHVQTPFEPSNGRFGAVELAARAGHLDIDSSAFPNYASPSGSVRGATEVTAGVNWYWSDNAKLVVDWDHTAFQGGARTPAEVQQGQREAENIVLLRAQLIY
ncbi:MAG: porin [Myxococcota bacterium]|nr:porin [Myxococcota bacterium]